VFELLAQYRVWWNEHRLQYGTDWHGEKERLFIQDDGSPLYPDTINFWLKKLLEHNSIPYITPHSLRHTFCTLELAAGTDYRTLQSLSGHAQASTLVNIYGHVLESAQRKAADALERVLLPPQNENIG
jgi:site-specific recombinase XerD